jgi:16S rRNA (uracil1498-N3)-methyltransferase
MNRFFVDPQTIESGQVTLPAGVTRQITRVLRMRIGDRFIVLDNTGQEYTVELLNVPEGKDRSSAVARIVRRSTATAEPASLISLYQAVLKGERFEWVLQKGTELGMMKFVPLLTDRVIPRDRGAVSKKRERWRSIISEAAEQSGRGRLPVLADPLDFGQACAEVQGSGSLGLLAFEGADDVGLKEAVRSLFRGVGHATPDISLFIGPEGGFTLDEVDQARQHGLQVVSLGPRILRAETAGLVAVSALLYEFGDLGG